MADTKRVLIALDKYKRHIFERNLRQAGYEWEEGDGITPEAVHFYVETDDVHALHMVIRTCEAQAQAYRQKRDRDAQRAKDRDRKKRQRRK